MHLHSHWIFCPAHINFIGATLARLAVHRHIRNNSQCLRLSSFISLPFARGKPFYRVSYFGLPSPIYVFRPLIPELSARVVVGDAVIICGGHAMEHRLAEQGCHHPFTFQDVVIAISLPSSKHPPLLSHATFSVVLFSHLTDFEMRHAITTHAIASSGIFHVLF